MISVFPVIFFGELPDKTMFASLVLASRGRPAAVWLGAAGAFLVHVVIAVTIGVSLFHLLPHRVVEGVVAVLFLVGAVWAIRSKEDEHDEEVAEEHASLALARTATTAFTVVFIAEWGDLTQILTANLAARYHSPLSVGIGAVLALWAVAAIAVTGGQRLLRLLPVNRVRQATAVILVVLALISGYSAIHG
jgi:putative Ca2+/H+ antiporter (TMEM165/GDT1 family)